MQDLEEWLHPLLFVFYATFTVGTHLSNGVFIRETKSTTLFLGLGVRDLGESSVNIQRSWCNYLILPWI